MDKHLLLQNLAQLQREIGGVQVSVLTYDLDAKEGRDAIREEIQSLCVKMIVIGESVGLS